MGGLCQESCLAQLRAQYHRHSSTCVRLRNETHENNTKLLDCKRESRRRLGILRDTQQYHCERPKQDPLDVEEFQ